MALTLYTIDSDELQYQRLGYIAVSLTDYTDGAKPDMAAGSKLECAVGLYTCTGNEDIDSTAQWGGIGASTLVYCYFNPVTLTLYLSIVAPVWSTTKQGYYMAASPTHRCWGSIFKSATNTYTQKTILLTRCLGIVNNGINLGIGDSTGTLIFDQTSDCFENLRSYKALAGTWVQLKSFNGIGEDTAFIIKKPITCALDSTVVTPQIGYIQSQNSFGWTTLSGSNANTLGPSAFTMNPGTFRIRNSAYGITNLYAVGVYGLNAVTLADIVG